MKNSIKSKMAIALMVMAGTFTTSFINATGKNSGKDKNDVKEERNEYMDPFDQEVIIEASASKLMFYNLENELVYQTSNESMDNCDTRVLLRRSDFLMEYEGTKYYLVNESSFVKSYARVD